VVNPAARALASAQSHSVVVLVPSLSNLLFIDTLEAIHQVCAQGLRSADRQLPLLA
jgi:LacI family gluconate utilization system Gnt-I transcriptional repressor